MSELVCVRIFVVIYSQTKLKILKSIYCKIKKNTPDFLRNLENILFHNSQIIHSPELMTTNTPQKSTRVFNTQSLLVSPTTLKSDARVRDVVATTPAEQKIKLRELSQGQRAFVLVPVGEGSKEALHLSLETDASDFFWEQRPPYVKPSFSIPPLSRKALLNPSSAEMWRPYFGRALHSGHTTKVLTAGISSGMLPRYAGSSHWYLHHQPTTHNVMRLVTGTPRWQLHPNRFSLRSPLCGASAKSRKGGVSDDDFYDNAHLEAPTDTLTPHFGFLFGFTQRSFVIWPKTVTDHKLRKRAEDLFCAGGGASSHFVKVGVEQLKALQSEGAVRQRFEWDNSEYIGVFANNALHEVDFKRPSTGVFVSPFNPDDPAEKWHFEVGRKVPRKHMDPKELHSHLVAENTPSETGVCMVTMSNRMSEQCMLPYNLPGFFWPSGKKTFAWCGPQGVGGLVKRMEDKFLIANQSGVPRRNVQFALPRDGAFNQLSQGDKYQQAVRRELPLAPLDFWFAEGAAPWRYDLLAFIHTAQKTDPAAAYRYGFCEWNTAWDTFWDPTCETTSEFESKNTRSIENASQQLSAPKRQRRESV